MIDPTKNRKTVINMVKERMAPDDWQRLRPNVWYQRNDPDIEEDEIAWVLIDKAEAGLPSIAELGANFISVVPMKHYDDSGKRTDDVYAVRVNARISGTFPDKKTAIGVARALMTNAKTREAIEKIKILACKEG